MAINGRKKSERFAVPTVFLFALVLISWSSNGWCVGLETGGGGGALDCPKSCITGVTAPVWTPFEHQYSITGCCQVSEEESGVHATTVSWTKEGNQTLFKANVLFIFKGQEYGAHITAQCAMDPLLYCRPCANWQRTGTLEPYLTGNLAYLETQFCNILPDAWRTALLAQDQPWPKDLPIVLNAPSPGLPPDFHYWDGQPPDNVVFGFSLPFSAGRPGDWAVNFTYQRWSFANQSWGPAISREKQGFVKGSGGKYNIIAFQSLEPGKYRLARAGYTYRDSHNNWWNSDMHDLMVEFTVGEFAEMSPHAGSRIGKKELVQKVMERMKPQPMVAGSGGAKILGGSAMIPLQLKNPGEGKPDLLFEHYSGGRWVPSREPLALRELPEARTGALASASWEYRIRTSGKWRVRAKGETGDWHEFEIPDFKGALPLARAPGKTDQAAAPRSIPAPPAAALHIPPPKIVAPREGAVFDEPVSLVVRVKADAHRDLVYKIGKDCHHNGTCSGYAYAKVNDNHFSNLDAGRYQLWVYYQEQPGALDSISFEVKSKGADPRDLVKAKTANEAMTKSGAKAARTPKAAATMKKGAALKP